MHLLKDQNSRIRRFTGIGPFAINKFGLLDRPRRPYNQAVLEIKRVCVDLL